MTTDSEIILTVCENVLLQFQPAQILPWRGSHAWDLSGSPVLFWGHSGVFKESLLDLRAKLCVHMCVQEGGYIPIFFFEKEDAFYLQQLAVRSTF